MGINNLVLIGTPIAKDSDLYKELLKNENIKNIIRVDIPNDEVTNLNSGGSFWAAFKNFITKGDDHPHFKFAFGKKANKARKDLAEDLVKQGVK